MEKVFISYAQENDGYNRKVRDLVARLRGYGLRVTFDEDMLPGGPKEGWNHWSRSQIVDEDTKVLVACSEACCACYEGRSTRVGRGASAEGRAIQQLLDDRDGANTRFRVILFDESHERHIPVALRTYQSFPVYLASGEEKLIWTCPPN